MCFIPAFSSITVEDILSYTPESPILAALVLLGVYCVKSVVMVLPIVALYLAAGMLFPTGTAVVITLLGIFMEATLGYLLGRKIGYQRVGKLIAKNKPVERFFSFQRKNSAAVCFVGRILPIPFDLGNLFFGASGQYILSTLLGMTPLMLPYVFAGKAISNPLSLEFLIPFGISLVAAATASCVFYKRTKSDSAK